MYGTVCGLIDMLQYVARNLRCLVIDLQFSQICKIFVLCV